MKTKSILFVSLFLLTTLTFQSCITIECAYDEPVSASASSSSNGDDYVLSASASSYNGGKIVVNEIVNTKKERQERDQKIFDNAYVLSENQIIVSDVSYKGGNGENLTSVECLPNETRVTFAVPIHFISNWISTASKCYAIKDKLTGDKYYVRKLDKEIPLNRVLIIKNHKHQMIELTYIFPPLKKDVRFVDFEEIGCEDTLDIPSNSAPETEFKNIDINEYIKGKKKDKNLKGKIYR